VDASDVGWGACAYQMDLPWTDDTLEQARGRVNDVGKRKIIEWISKSWTKHELKLPVFYRETNIVAGVALYTDHKPGLFENSLSNKGQLSAWELRKPLICNR
jgi:hypothetical protein